jgi:hypothetical protein
VTARGYTFLKLVPMFVPMYVRYWDGTYIVPMRMKMVPMRMKMVPMRMKMVSTFSVLHSDLDGLRSASFCLIDINSKQIKKLRN